MALDDASPQAGDPPFQQNDGSTGSNGIAQFQIKPEAVVTPDLFTLYFGFGGPSNWQRRLVAVLSQRVESCRAMIERPPTQEEMDAFVTINSRTLYHNRVGGPVGFIAYSARAYSQARKTPYYKMLMPEAAESKYPSPRQIVQAVTKFAKTDPTAFKQSAAIFSFRALFWTLSGATLSSMYAVYNDAKATLAEPRLAGFVEAMKRQDPEEVRKRRLQGVAARYNENQRRRQQQQQQPSGEMAPEQGTFAESEPQDGYQSLYSNDASGSSAETTTTTTEPHRVYNEPVMMQSTKPNGQDPVSDIFDDASPTAPEYQTADRPEDTSTSNTFQRGAWDRIRQQNASGSPSRVEPFRQPSEAWTTQGSSSNPDSERQREREQARAEFERLLDAERNMSSDDGSQRKGWGKWN